MDKQKIFNTAWDYFLVQQKAPGIHLSANGEAKCLYLAPDGNKCAIGCQLTDEQAASLPMDGIEGIMYEANYETDSSGSGDAVSVYREAVNHLREWFDIDDKDEGDVCFLETLQSCHDSSATTYEQGHIDTLTYPQCVMAPQRVMVSIEDFRAGFKRKMRNLAEEWALSVPAQ